MRHRVIPVLLVALGLTACGDDSGAPPADDTTTTSATTSATTSEDPTRSSAADVTTTDPVAPSTPDDPSTTTSSTTTIPLDTTSSTTEPTMTTLPSVAVAVADLADRLGIAPEEIEVVSVEEVTWPDGSLGCPEPDMVYTQALVNGQLIVLSVDGTLYEYHSGRGRDPFYCPAKYVQPPVPDGSTDPDI